MLTRELARKMRRDWDRRARENARHYIVTGRQQWSDDEFYRSGEIALAEDILNDMGNICQGKDPRQMTVLEIGCGAGRVTRALAGLFGQVYAVDVSEEMVRQARRALAHLPNIKVLRNNGVDLSVLSQRRWGRPDRGTPKIDFAFSCMVFQHIASREVIENYVREVHRLLVPGGLFKFQVQGAATATPQPGDTWVGVPFTEEDARRMAARCGFQMRYHWGAGDQYYWLWFFKGTSGEDVQAS